MYCSPTSHDDHIGWLIFTAMQDGDDASLMRLLDPAVTYRSDADGLHRSRPGRAAPQRLAVPAPPQRQASLP
jgi:hypothetical protein